MRFLFAFLILLSGGCDWLRPSLGKKVVVDVNGKQLTGHGLAQELAYRLRDQDALSAKDPKLVKVVKDKIVEEFIVQTLSEEWAAENGIVVKAEDLERQIQSVKNSYPDDLAFQQALAEQGMTFKEWKDRLEATLLQKEVSQKLLTQMAPPADSELMAYYQDHTKDFAVRESAQIRQILVPMESDAKSIEVELKKGKRMADLAKKYSISPEAPQGGNVGWIEKGLTDIFESAFRMKPGMRSPIVKSSFGYHIFEVTGRKPSRQRLFAEAKEDVRRILMEKKQQSLYLAWLEERVRKARVFKDQAFIDALKVETRAQ